MEHIIAPLLALHVISGTTALLAGLLAISARKGGRLHQRAGTLFFAAMVAVAITAVLLALHHGSRFLLHIGVFALYQDHAGWRSVRNKSLMPATQDLVMLAIGAMNGLLMLATFNPVLLVFGGINTLLVIGDLRTFLGVMRGRTAAPKAWLRRHIGMMLGTYIATSTAFLLTFMRNMDVGWIHWLLPTIIGVPLIMYNTWRHTRPANIPATARPNSA